MAAEVQTSILAKALGAELVNAHRETKDKPVEIGNANLPEGIEVGVAQLAECKIGIYKEGEYKGKPFFMASGIVKMPKEFKGMQIEGLRTQVGPISLCATPTAKGKKKTFADHYADFLNELKKLGVATEQSPTDTPEKVDAFLRAAMAELNRAKPYFMFRTWKGKPSPDYPNPKTNHEWNGVCEFNPEDPYANGVVAAGADAGPGQSPLDKQQPVDQPPHTAPARGAAPVQAAAPAAQAPTESVASWCLIADADPKGLTEDGKKANRIVTQAALAAGLDIKVVNAAANWVEVGKMIEAASGPVAQPSAPPPTPPAATATAAASSDVPPPVVDAVYDYQLRDASGNPDTTKAPVQIQIVSVNTDTRTVTAKTLEGKLILDGQRRPSQIRWEYLS